MGPGRRFFAGRSVDRPLLYRLYFDMKKAFLEKSTLMIMGGINVQGEQKTKLFREKSLEAIESPESLNDYLRVTSPGVWLIMGAVIALLTGLILWGVFGRIDTTVKLAVESKGGNAVCYVPYNALKGVAAAGKVTLDGVTYELSGSEKPNIVTVSEEMDPLLRIAGDLKVGDMTVAVPLAKAPEDGVHTAVAVTESLKPIALLLK